MRFFVRATLPVLALAVAVLAPRAAAQGAPAVHVDLAAAQGTRLPAVSATHILDDPPLQELMHNGFPVELHFRLELWRTGGMFNHLEHSTHWEVLVQYLPDPYRPVYRILRRDGKQSEDFGAFASLDSAQAVLAQPYRVRLTPSRKDERYYYNVVLEVESLNASDLGELERWVHGDLQPAVQGDGNPLAAIKNGVGRLLSRLLGGAHRSYEATSPTFVAGGN